MQVGGIKMCVYVGSEVLLANLLSYRENVSELEIELYSEKLKNILKDEKENVYINLNDNALEYVLMKYEKEFRRFQGRFFVNESINLNQFNDRFDSNISSMLMLVAQNL